MILNKESNIGSIVAENYRAATVFKSYNIDFCCNGNRSLEQVCREKAIPENILIEKLSTLFTDNSGSDNIDFKNWPADLLIDYIEKKHHRYVRQRIPQLIQFLQKLCKVHGSRHPELLEIQSLFLQSAEDLKQHMIKEEKVLFPAIRRLESGYSETAGTQNEPMNVTIKLPVDVLKQEHSTEGARMEQISKLSDGFTPPEDACATYKVTFSLLKEFEEDLHHHIHLENNILFPKALSMEKVLQHA